MRVDHRSAAVGVALRSTRRATSLQIGGAAQTTHDAAQIGTRIGQSAKQQRVDDYTLRCRSSAHQLQL